MSGIYVLIMVAASYHSATSLSQEFDSLAACERAQTAISEGMDVRGIALRAVYIDCVPKGDQ